VLRQIAIVVAVFLITLLGLRAIGMTMAGPVAVTLACFAAWACLRAAGESSQALGLARPAHLGKTLLAGLGYALLAYLAAIASTLLATRVLGWPPMQTARLATIAGNPLVLAGWLAIAWTTAAFGEEVLYRGFLLDRLRALLGTSRAAAGVAVLLQAVAFGFSHAYQGATGILVSGTLGLVFGLLYLRAKSLWPLVIAHGLIDTVGLVAMYARVLPT
jgi:membrane protease YdiL (CAAX protease family)